MESRPDGKAPTLKIQWVSKVSPFLHLNRPPGHRLSSNRENGCSDVLVLCLNTIPLGRKQVRGVLHSWCALGYVLLSCLENKDM